jgi:signal peptide peptidase SppA
MNVSLQSPATRRGSSFGPAHGASRLFDLVVGPWALTPAMLDELQAVYCTHLRGEKIDLRAVEASIGRPLANQQRSFDVVDGVAVLPVQGVISPKANLMTQISGGASAQLLQRDLATAMADPRVSAIVLAIDSPGGSVFGSPDLAAQVFAARDTKPIVAHTDGLMASAAYWIGSAAGAVYNSGPTVMVGSIGVVARHINANRPDVTEITAGAYKRIASDAGPLTEEGRAYMQAQVDYYYSLFVDAVAQHRGVSTEQVLSDMADGRVFIGQQAIDAGLVDGVSTLDALVAQMAADPGSVTRRPGSPKRRSARGPRADADAASVPEACAGDARVEGNCPAVAGDAPADPPTTERTDIMPPADANLTRESLECDHAPLMAALRSDFLAEGAAQERARIDAVRQQALPGHEALIDRLAMDGRTTGPEAAAAVLAAERTARQAAAAAHQADAPAPAPAAAAPSDAPRDARSIAKSAVALLDGIRPTK